MACAVARKQSPRGIQRVPEAPRAALSFSLPLPPRLITVIPDPDPRMTSASKPALTPSWHPTDAHLADPDHHPSFTKGVFLGEIREELIFPFPVLSPDERESLGMILGSFRAFAADTIDSHQIDADGKFPDAVRRGMHELGLMGM